MADNNDTTDSASPARDGGVTPGTPAVPAVTQDTQSQAQASYTPQLPPTSAPHGLGVATPVPPQQPAVPQQQPVVQVPTAPQQTQAFPTEPLVRADEAVQPQPSLPQQSQPSHPQPTVPGQPSLPALDAAAAMNTVGHGNHGGPGAPAGPGTAFGTPASAAPKRNHSTGTLLAGLAAAALIGGIVGGGVSSLVMANSNSSTPSVVQQGTVKLSNPNNATDINGVAAVATPSVVTISVASQTASGSGSGVIYNKDGYIITNAHVVTLDGAANNAKVRVKLSDGRMYDGKVVGVAPYSDIAVVKIDADNLTPIEIADSNNVNVGDRAVAIGAPLNLSNTVTSGVVSALNRGISVGSPLIPQDKGQRSEQQPEDGEGGQQAPDSGRGFPWDFRFDTPHQQQPQQQATGGQVTLPVIQTDASINPGNSGGALLNGEGKLIGINVAIASPGASDGTASSAGLGFAIPSDLAKRIAEEIIAGEKPSHGMLGASVADASSDPSANVTHAGGLVKELVNGGAAEAGGLRVGDIITGIDGVAASDGTSVSALIRMHAGGSKVKIDYIRGGQNAQTEVTLGTLDW